MYDVETCLLFFAQGDNAPALPGEPANTGSTTGADGSPDGAGGGSGGGGSASPFGGQFILIMVVVLVAMILFSVLGQRKEKKRRAAMLSNISKHDKVQTIGGVVGSVVEVKSDEVVLKVDESSNTRITFARSAVQQVLTGNGAALEATPLEKN